MATDPKPTIQERMAAILEALPPIGKEAFNPGLKFNFRSIDAVLNALNPLLAKHGVFVLPEVGEVRTHTRPTKYGEASVAVITVTYRFVADDGTFVEATSVGEGQDSGDKSVSKAMTMAFKTCLGQVFAISTEEDPDGGSFAEEAKAPPATPAKRAAKPRGAAKEETPAPPSPPGPDLDQLRSEMFSKVKSLSPKEIETFKGWMSEQGIGFDFSALTFEQIQALEVELVENYNEPF